MDDKQLNGITTLTRWAGVTATCRCRAHNEDDFLVIPASEVFAVADGCGGGASGRRPAEMTLACFGDEAGIRTSASPYRAPEPPSSPLPSPADPLARAVVSANTAVWDDAQRDPRARGQGCAVIAVRVQPGWVATTHIGDCRLGRLRQGEFTWLTEDHTLWVEMQQAGADAAEVERLRREHATVITRAIGVDTPLDVELHYHRTEPDDLMLLCSDGLWRELTRAQIVETLSSPSRQLTSLCRDLLAAVEAAGGHDNTTIILAELRSA